MTDALKREPTLIGGAIVALANAIVVLAGLGAFDDGLQAADLIPILLPVIAAAGVRGQVWSQESVDELRDRLLARTPDHGPPGKPKTSREK